MRKVVRVEYAAAQAARSVRQALGDAPALKLVGSMRRLSRDRPNSQSLLSPRRTPIINEYGIRLSYE